MPDRDGFHTEEEINELCDRARDKLKAEEKQRKQEFEEWERKQAISSLAILGYALFGDKFKELLNKNKK